MNALHIARANMTEVIAKARLSKASSTRVPASAYSYIQIGDKILIYRDDPGKWVGPHRVIDVDHKQSM